MQELFNITDEMEQWRKEGSRQKLGIVSTLPDDERNEFSNYFAVIIQDSPLGWVPVSSRWKFGSKMSAREKVHRLGYTCKIEN